MRLLTLAIFSTLLFNSCSEDKEPFPADVFIYPNPFGDTFEMRLNLNEDAYIIIRMIGAESQAQIGNIERFEPNGSGILFEGKKKSGEYNFQFDVEKQPSGVYLLDISINNIGKRIRIQKK